MRPGCVLRTGLPLQLLYPLCRLDFKRHAAASLKHDAQRAEPKMLQQCGLVFAISGQAKHISQWLHKQARLIKTHFAPADLIECFPPLDALVLGRQLGHCPGGQPHCGLLKQHMVCPSCHGCRNENSSLTTGLLSLCPSYQHKQYSKALPSKVVVMLAAAS